MTDQQIYSMFDQLLKYYGFENRNTKDWHEGLIACGLLYRMKPRENGT